MNENDTTQYLVVINQEEQYSIWPSHLPVPPGWKVQGDEASKEECLSQIEQLWTDMRPLSLRLAMQNGEGS